MGIEPTTSGLDLPQLEQVCFICQREIDINSLTRCRRTSCCGMFMHKSCHHQMVTMLPTCGICRRENDEYQREIVLETDKEMDSDEENPFEMPIGTAPPVRNTHVVMELIEYRHERRYLNTHYRSSLFWPEIPFEADPSIWPNYYYKLELFTRLFPDNPLFVHGRVMLPISPTSEMRRAVYRMFMHNTPFNVFDITRCFALRLLFIGDESANTLRVENLCLMPYSGGPPLYPDLLYC